MNKLTGLKQLSVVYDDPTHTYTLNNKYIAGVSSIAELLPKPYLVQWSASECAKYVRENVEACAHDGILDIDKLEAMLKLAKTAHRRKSKEAADTGTIMHGLIEKHIKGEPVGPMDEMQKRSAKMFIEWEKANGVEWLASELLVANEPDEFAGRLDACAMVNGKKTIVDFKVSKSISDSYFLQTAGYWSALNWMGWTAEQRIIVRIPKTYTLDVWDNKTRRYNTVDNVLEIVQVPTDLQFDVETFSKLRTVYKWINQQILKELH